MRDLITKEEIKQVFAKKIKPRIASLEVDRAETVKNLWLYCGGLSVVLLVISFSFFVDALQMAIPVSASIIFFLGKMITAKFTKRFKREVIKEVFTALIPGCDYRPQSKVNQQTYDASNLCNSSYDTYEGEDHVRGKIGDMAIEFSEIRLTKRTKTSKNNSSQRTVYQGIFFSFTLPKDLRQNTLILADQAEKMLGRNVGRFLQKNMGRSGYELVQVESVEFEKHYVVYSNDQVKSRVLLKPMVLENLNDFRKKNKQIIDVSICGKMLYLSMKTDKNHFEPKLWGELVSFKDIREIYDLVMLVRDLQEDLELDQAS